MSVQGALASELVASAVVETVVSVAVVPDSGTARWEGRPLRQGTSLEALH
eukprot:COSAG05_NODE_6612_length_931_cov_0.855769_1_plen_50_part_00